MLLHKINEAQGWYRGGRVIPHLFIRLTKGCKQFQNIVYECSIRLFQYVLVSALLEYLLPRSIFHQK